MFSGDKSKLLMTKNICEKGQLKQTLEKNTEDYNIHSTMTIVLLHLLVYCLHIYIGLSFHTSVI